eukprot:1373828-Pleurochrysis_carterae.AAC.1
MRNQAFPTAPVLRFNILSSLWSVAARSSEQDVALPFCPTHARPHITTRPAGQQRECLHAAEA